HPLSPLFPYTTLFRSGYLTPLAGIAAVGGLLVVLWRSRDWRYLGLVTVVVLPLLLLIRHGQGLEIHYFAFLLPPLFLLAGIGFDALLTLLPVLRTPGFAVVGLLLMTQTLAFRHFTEFLERHGLLD